MSRRVVEAAMLLRTTYLRYVAASAAALAVDFAIFLAALSAAVPPTLAAGIGYAAGILAHWWLSSRAVFSEGLANRGGDRRRQQALFLVSALIGLTITMGVVGTAARLGLDARLAKIAAIGVAFQTTYMLRRRIVFA